MKKLSLCICFIIAVTLLITSGAFARKLLIVGEVFAPFEFVDKGKPMGIDVDTVDAIMKKMGIEYEIKLMPWKEAWDMVEKGKADAVFSTSKKPDREPFVWYPKENMWVTECVFFVRKDKKKPDFKGYADAKGLKVGVVKESSYNQAFWEAKLNTVEAPDVATNLILLAKGEIDLAPADKIVGRYTLLLNKLEDKIDPYNHVLFSKDYFMPFVKKSDYPKIKEVADRFDSELTALKKSGQHVQILAKWLRQNY